MVKFYKTFDNNLIKEIDTIEEGCWIHVTNPNSNEITFLVNDINIDPDFIKASLDREERAHIQTEKSQTFISLDIPIKTNDGNLNNALLYTTIPIGIVLTNDYIITICSEKNDILTEIADNKIRDIRTNLRTRFFLIILLRISVKYLYYLRQIERISENVEYQLHRSMKNKELIQLLGLEKSLVYFSTSLKSNEVVLRKILNGRFLKLYEEDHDILEDVMIEVGQAIEMSNIYSTILSGTMDAFASIISNNLNIVMKVLTSITIIMSIPNMVFSFYGMNVTNLPFPNFISAITISIIIMIIVFLVLRKKNML